MPRPQTYDGQRKRRATKKRRRGRIPDPATRAARSKAGRKKTAVVWALMAAVGVGLCLLGLIAWPLIPVGGLFVVIGLLMAVREWRLAGA
jgi:hypothetical protein